MQLAFFYLFMGYGIPSVFYGDEYYIEGTTEPEYRKAMPWQQEESAGELFREWILLRKKHSAIRQGRYLTILCEDEPGIYVFCRADEKETVPVILNNSEKDFSAGEEFWEKVEAKLGSRLSQKPAKIPAFTGKVLIP